MTTTTATGPKTSEGKRIAARNATTHGLFARDVVLPRLGEDPTAYEAFLQELTAQLSPKNLLEQHYTEKIAAASWRLRRLHRWQAQLVEDVDLSEDEVLAKLDRVMRHETTLHRQIDTSVKMLGRELPRLFEGRVREDLIRRMNETERGCKDDPYLDQWITEETRKRSSLPTVPPSLDLSRLDTTDKDTAATAPIASNCAQKCQNELACDHCSSASSEGVPMPAASPKVSISALRKARRFQQQQKCQNEPAPCPGMAEECTGAACCAPTPHPPTYPNNRDAGEPCDRGTREQADGFRPATLSGLRQRQRA